MRFCILSGLLIMNLNLGAASPVSIVDLLLLGPCAFPEVARCAGDCILLLQSRTTPLVLDAFAVASQGT